MTRELGTYGKCRLSTAAILIAVIGLLAVVGQATAATSITLDNGMQVILRENHSSPMITSLIFVKAGSKYEDNYNNGVTHFLEHLLFDGTAIQTQEQLSDGIERLGGYINAFTREDMTGYLVLMPRDYIEYGMATEADMLFNSVFPEDKLPKERKIIIEEIKKDNDAEGAPAERFASEKTLAGTTYTRPVLGFESTIANMPREAVIDYWKRFYAPNNMIALIIGDFETEKMTETVKSIFGKFPRVELPIPPVIESKGISGKNVFRAAAKTKSTYIDFSIQAPQYKEPEYFAFNLLSDYLSDEENSPLMKALKTGAEPLASSISVSLDTKEEFSRLDIQILTEKKEMADSIVAVTDRILESIAANAPSEELLNGYRVSRRCNEIFMSEKLHYYGFTLAPLMVITGQDFFEKIQERIDSTKVGDIVTACNKYLAPANYIATIVTPVADEKETAYQPTGPTEDQVNAHFRTTRLPVYDLSAGKKFRMPEIKESSGESPKYATYLREVFDNGLTVVVKSNQSSRVFALNVIGKNRSANEPEGKDGITDFVNRLIEKGTTTRPAEQLSKELAAIGANVTLYDNPWIPYDDKYTTRQFSFMKFETIEEFKEKGIELFADMIANPAFDSTQVEKTRAEILGLLGRGSGSTYKVARNLFYSALFGATPYGKTIEGDFRTIGSISMDDLRGHHRRFYSPENMIITVGTADSARKVMDMLKTTLGKIPASGIVQVEAIRPANFSGINTAHKKMEKEQIYIYMGNLVPSASSPDAAALDVSCAVLSKRIQESLREKQGLAYSTGAGVTLDKNFGWYVCSIGTGVANFEKAKQGIIAEIERLRKEMPTEDEVTTAINSLWGSNLTANLSRINQAFYMGVNEYLGLGYDYDEIYIDNIRQVDKGLVMKTIRRYFDTKNYVIATAGNM